MFSPPFFQAADRNDELLKDLEGKNRRVDALDAQVARYEEFLAGRKIPADARRWLDPEIVMDVERMTKRVRRNGGP